MKNDLVQYPVILSKDGGYVFVRVPDLPSGYTQGNDTLDAVRMAQDLIGNLLEDSDEYPTASEPEDIKLEKGERLVYVSVDMSSFRRKFSRKVRKNITIPEYLNDISKKNGWNVSQITTEALEAKLN